MGVYSRQKSLFFQLSHSYTSNPNFTKFLFRTQSNICKKAILEEVSNGIHGLAYECKQICRELELPDIMGTFVNKNRIKSSIFLKMNEKALEDMRNSNKVSNR